MSDGLARLHDAHDGRLDRDAVWFHFEPIRFDSIPPRGKKKKEWTHGRTAGVEKGHGGASDQRRSFLRN